MLEVLLIVSTFFLFIIFISLLIGIKRRSRQMSDHQYLVYFEQVNHTIDLNDNSNLKNKVTILSENPEKGIYTIRTHLTDIKVKELLMREYRLTLSQVFVITEQIEHQLELV
ncbi:hypothetical protein MX081_02680 [Streptococcus uberis]|uniref:hypothetical protein n=1 Tax=Streptococcus uberis TaxID=1349 RepID=UPI001FF436CA|nr:hypothetical protein [Streptococcus uberis]MCK1161260.1 hypothetical protein [Streptococcus uberis]MCK1165013.1 hypothetical protein [Streptococcus uberis]MCK1251171.1 hypothetical protein [Streptococcus uberis]MCK1253022.1 hypothetical protein [Streptococcus uberis]